MAATRRDRSPDFHARQRGLKTTICAAFEDAGFRPACLPAVGLFDVLEHIANDRAELEHASTHLRPGGHLVVLAPAHAWLYSEFDRAVGHERRYTGATLRAAGPPLRVAASFYLDSVGMFASTANRFLLRRGVPTIAHIRFWDRWLVRASRWLNPALGHSVGKSVVVVWAR